MGKHTEPSAWQVACYALAVPIVYLFGQQFLELLYVTLMALFIIPCWLLFHVLPTPSQLADFGMPDSQHHSLLGALLLIPVALLVMLLKLAVIVTFGLIGLAYMLVLAIPAWVLTWTIDHPLTPPWFAAAVGLVWLSGTFLYGVGFPFLWRAAEPLLAHTLGEITFQRARQRIYGVGMRLDQPLYLMVAVVVLSAAAVRVVEPLIGPVQDYWRVLPIKLPFATPRNWS